ncbi:MAG: tRNA (adenosine(37)-N6)-threonylcarbamoyltransferase complex ATPase subunit type 1 TsaE [Oscillospiraceae bacterium]|jgi:tRNA threonylcarbamoyladenosine biosynthesis protein TsaE|nr:tRNA (adenosine(37)-N6)-threonylcarbamoyltransferase complex ATPase subunit type 1 TsaE [Oscillospiraceae bacterium]
MLEIESNSPAQTEYIGYGIGKKLLSNQKIIALYGGLAAGKTTFVKGLARAFDFLSDVTSPTFTLVNEYDGKVKLYHYDMYRVKSWEDLVSTGFFDLDSEDVAIVEWSENIDRYFPDGVLKIKFKIIDVKKNKRMIIINN